MRLDRFFSEQGLLSRTDVKSAVRAGRISVNGKTAPKENLNIDENADTVALDGVPLLYKKYVYYAVNKPAGYVSATEDGKDRVVTELLPESVRRRNIFPCGRLDKNTTGLMLLTDDGPLSHDLLSPRHHVQKVYAFTVKFPLSDADVTALENGVDIGTYVTKPCTVVLNGEKSGRIVLTEGKYHQIKLMAEAVHNQITSLTRIAFGPLTLTDDLGDGDCRELNEDEIRALKNTVKG